MSLEMIIDKLPDVDPPVSKWERQFAGVTESRNFWACLRELDEICPTYQREPDEHGFDVTGMKFSPPSISELKLIRKCYRKGVWRGQDVQIEKLKNIPVHPCDISFCTYGEDRGFWYTMYTWGTNTTAFAIDPSRALIIQLMLEFRSSYVKATVGAFSQQQMVDMFLLKYKGYKFTDIIWGGKTVVANWTLKGRFGKRKRAGYTVWTEGKKLRWIEGWHAFYPDPVDSEVELFKFFESE
ncbi:hypothetical protein TWF730_004552 [Orbilia blumenaviensis]|uniref:Uncharacterized protein n=1 Tax=Orbilia blumenaviensis TaxID=1796055 RepID=A0AAV9U2I8_9PEZI